MERFERLQKAVEAAGAEMAEEDDILNVSPTAPARTAACHRGDVRLA